jgi:hypothetical protein
MKEPKLASWGTVLPEGCLSDRQRAQRRAVLRSGTASGCDSANLDFWD